MIDTKAIRARCEATTEGPWQAVRWDKGDSGKLTVMRKSPTEEGKWCLLDYEENAAFIAASRVDVIALCDRVEALEEQLRVDQLSNLQAAGAEKEHREHYNRKYEKLERERKVLNDALLEKAKELAEAEQTILDASKLMEQAAEYIGPDEGGIADSMSELQARPIVMRLKAGVWTEADMRFEQNHDIEAAEHESEEDDE